MGSFSLCIDFFSIVEVVLRFVIVHEDTGNTFFSGTFHSIFFDWSRADSRLSRAATKSGLSFKLSLK